MEAPAVSSLNEAYSSIKRRQTDKVNLLGLKGCGLVAFGG